ncbi:SUKH-4 family immunity protein [Streptomyces sp. NPDC096132]|uniref:SUKH-4 family immunity protein n=1 Tax=Streptomyces sp. NPDC096132 TaxID=3366075 RepID=UPI00381B8EB5
MDDAELATLLAECSGVPYPGTWQDRPFAERTVDGVRYALIALDPGLSAIGWHRAEGSLWLLTQDGVPSLVNSSPEAFAAFTRAYEEAALEASLYEGAEADDDEDAALRAADALTDTLIDKFNVLDAVAVADENSFWHTAAEELGYSMDV